MRFYALRPAIRRRERRLHSRGQALVEFAIVLPLLLLLLVMAIDFGRVFFGWVGLQNAARIGAAYAAAHPSGWETPGDPEIADAFIASIENDLRTINCTPGAIGDPTHVDSDGNGNWDDREAVVVSLTCAFDLITPLASNIVGGTIDVQARSEFYVNRTIQAGVQTPPPPPNTPTPIPTPVPTASPTPVGATPTASPSPGAPTPSATPCTVPVADFTATPVSGTRPLQVQFTDTSTSSCPITAWQWNLGDGAASTRTVQNPSYRYNPGGNAASTTYTVSLTVTNSGGSDTKTVPAMITVFK